MVSCRIVIGQLPQGCYTTKLIVIDPYLWKFLEMKYVLWVCFGYILKKPVWWPMLGRTVDYINAKVMTRQLHMKTHGRLFIASNSRSCTFGKTCSIPLCLTWMSNQWANWSGLCGMRSHKSAASGWLSWNSATRLTLAWYAASLTEPPQAHEQVLARQGCVGYCWVSAKPDNAWPVKARLGQTKLAQIRLDCQLWGH